MSQDFFSNVLRRQIGWMDLRRLIGQTLTDGNEKKADGESALEPDDSDVED